MAVTFHHNKTKPNPPAGQLSAFGGLHRSALSRGQGGDLGGGRHDPSSTGRQRELASGCRSWPAVVCWDGSSRPRDPDCGKWPSAWVCLGQPSWPGSRHAEAGHNRRAISRLEMPRVPRPSRTAVSAHSEPCLCGIAAGILWVFTSRPRRTAFHSHPDRQRWPVRRTG